MSDLLHKKAEIIERYGAGSFEADYAAWVFANREGQYFEAIYNDLMGQS